MTATKRKSSTIKAFRGGRPRIGAEPLTVADRSRRYRAKRRAQVQVETPEDAGVRRAEEALKSLCASRNIREGTSEHLIASRWINAMAEKAYNDAVKLMDMMPPRIVNADVSSPVVTPSAAKARLLALVEANIEADQYEEQREVDRLRAEVARLKAKCGEALPPPGNGIPEDTVSTDRVIDPPTGDIVPPREQTDRAENMRGPRYDAPRKLVTIDHEPVKAAAPTSAWNGPQDGPPPWLQTPAQNAARAAAKPPPAPSSPSSSSPPSPPPAAPERTPNWDSTAGGVAWRMWADAGGYSGDGLCAAGWIDKLSGR